MHRVTWMNVGGEKREKRWDRTEGKKGKGRGGKIVRENPVKQLLHVLHEHRDEHTW